jgi:sugar transferase (PEP-CTERM/EpsH1 system associated)
MKLLFVANRVPYPPYRGDKLKIYNLGKKLRDKNELHLIAIAESKEDMLHREELESVFHSVTFFYLPKWLSFLQVILGVFSRLPLQVAYFRSSRFQTKLNQHLATHHYDGIHVQHLRMSQFFTNHHRKNVILDLPDAFSLYWNRRSKSGKKWWMRQFAAMEYKRLLRYEKEVLPQFDLNLVCSPEDQQYLAEHTGANLSVLPNGVDTDHFQPRANVNAVANRILFTGNMDYEPNVDAVEYFCTEIFPEIQRVIPEAEFIIAGQRPVPRVLRLASGNIKITGFIKDLGTEYARATVVVAPLRFGAGTQNKVLEAMAMGVPVVCTEVGFKGLGIKSGEGAILAQDKDAFVDSVVSLLQDKALCKKVAEAGREVIIREFSWHAVAQKLEGYFHKLTQ